MPTVSIRDNVLIAYDIIRPAFPTPDFVVLTLGGRQGVKSSKGFAAILATILKANVLIWDRRNSNNSSINFGEECLFIEDAKDLKELLLTLNVPLPCLFVGSSSGARISAMFTFDNPKFVRGLVLAPPTGGDSCNAV